MRTLPGPERPPALCSPPPCPSRLCPAALPPQAPRSLPGETRGNEVAVVALFPTMFSSFSGQKEEIQTSLCPGLPGLPEVASHTSCSGRLCSLAEFGCSPAPPSSTGAWPHSKPRGLHRWHHPSPRSRPGLHQLPWMARSRFHCFLIQTVSPPAASSLALRL